MKILIADESNLIRSVIIRILQEKIPSLTVLEAERNETVLSLLQTEEPDVVIADAGGLHLSLQHLIPQLADYSRTHKLIFISQFPESEIIVPFELKKNPIVKKEHLHMLTEMIYQNTIQEN